MNATTANTLEVGFTVGIWGNTYTVVNYRVSGNRIDFITLVDEDGNIENLERYELAMFITANKIRGWK